MEGSFGEREAMTLAAGVRLGPYEVLSPLGSGGMGEVYKAKDTRLDRTVAIKVLPSHLSENSELRQRFEREARAISALTHPHICTLHDVGNQDGIEFLVMECLEGESLADRLAKGPLPPDQVLKFGIEIADALEMAHRHGIVHRDLKPANIMLTKSGVKLLDFGLAKHRAAVVQSEIAQLTSLPTEASPSQPLTERGTILGTFQYMSPEQLEGKDADARSDIFAFGCVLYEMAAGRKAFTGRSRASLIGSILKEEPPAISTIQPMTPPALDRLVHTCLAKEPEDRFQTAHDVKLQLQWIVEGGSQAGAPAVIAARRKSRERLAWATSGVLFLAALLLGIGYVRRSPAPPRPVRFQILPSEGLNVVGSPRISPDGRFIAFSATDAGGKAQLWVRPLESLEARPVPGTEGASFRPFWSPDSRFIGFVASGKLKKVNLSGAPPQTICDAPSGADGAWSREGVILFDGEAVDPIRRVSAAGGTAQSAVVPPAKAGNVGWPEFLPDGRHFLYNASETGSESKLMLASLDGKGPPKELLSVGSRVQYADPGYLLYVRDGTLVAQPFDARSLKVTGEPVPLTEKMSITGGGLADFSAAGPEALVYRGGEGASNRLQWVDRTGKVLSEIDKPQQYGNTAISPDGKRVAFEIRDPRTDKRDIWIRDLSRGVSSRFTFGPSDNFSPIWSPDGTRIVFCSDRKGPPGLYEKAASGTGQERELWSCGEPLSATDWSRDGRFLAVSRLSAKTDWDIWIVPTDGKTQPFAFLQERYMEIRASFSPDGRWIAYQSNESGRTEVYVQQFPGPGGKWQISTEGGVEPHWSGDGKEIFYTAADSKIESAAVETGATFNAAIPRTLFDARLEPVGRRNRVAVTRDGKQFLLLSPLGKERMQPLNVILHWTASLGS
jgi:Tol biopolymer transport system component